MAIHLLPSAPPVGSRAAQRPLVGGAGDDRALMEAMAGQACVRCGDQLALDERAWFELENKALKVASLREMIDEPGGFTRAWHVRCVDAPLRPGGS